MNAPKSRHIRSSLNGRSVHAGPVGHELRGLPVHIMVSIQILVTEHLMIGRESFYHSHRREPKVRTRIRPVGRGIADMDWPAGRPGRETVTEQNGRCFRLAFVAHDPSH